MAEAEVWPAVAERRAAVKEAARKMSDEQLRATIEVEREEVARAREALERAEDDYRIVVMEAATRGLRKGREERDG